VGANQNGAAFAEPLSSPLIFVVIAFVLNFILIYRGISKGIELFCQLAMPTLLVIAVIILIRVLTLGTPNPEQPQQNVLNGLGYMWNPVQQAEKIAPGDQAVANLVKRSTSASAQPNTEGGRLKGFSIDQPKGFEWALQQAGWTRKAPADSDAKESDAKQAPPLAGRWEHPDTDVTVEVSSPGSAKVVNGGDAGVSLENGNEPLQTLIDWLPRDVAAVATEDSAFDQLDVEEPTAFKEALAVTGWQPGDEAWAHPDSRLSIEFQDQQATIHAPGFWEMLGDGNIWLAAAGQIFFSLSVGFGVIVTYASYMQPDDDVMLSGVTAATGNGFCELVLAGLTIVPAGFIFLGSSFVANPPGTFGMGFVSLPEVFNQMPAGWLFGFLFFFLLFLAAMTSTISLLQPGIAFLEEGLGLGRRASVAVLGLFTAIGAAFIMYFSQGHTALSTIDFWTANVGITVLATITVIVYGWVLGVDNGVDELRRGAEIPVPRILRFVIRYVSPVFLVGILIFSFSSAIVDRLVAVWTDPTVMLSFGLFIVALIFFSLLVVQAVSRWRRGEPPLSAEQREAVDQGAHI
jgi:SNF family Na+-dependent transporter